MAAATAPTGIDSVPGSAHSPAPTVTGSSVKRVDAGAALGAAGGVRGVMFMPAILFSGSKDTITMSAALSNWQPVTTVTLPVACLTTRWLMIDVRAPAWRPIVVHTSRSRETGIAAAILALNSAATSSNLPASRRSSTRVA